MKAVIIGSGLSGLIAGTVLARAGHDVQIFEQFERPGGVTSSFETGGFKWDLGQLLIEGFDPQDPCGRILADLGVLDQIRLKKDERGYVFPDFEIKKPAEFGGIKWRMDQLAQLFPGEEKGLAAYWQQYLRFTRLMTLARSLETATGLNRLLTQANLYLTLLPFLPELKWNARQLMDSLFSSEKLKCVFMSILADFFTPPNQFQGLGVFALNAEGSFESRQPRRLAPGAETLYHYSVLGGMNTLVRALVLKIEENGGSIHCSRPINRIVLKNQRVSAVIDGAGVNLPADVVIASGGVQELFFDLIGEDLLPVGLADKIRCIPRMDSVFMLHLGLDADPSDRLHGVCTYFYGTYDIAAGVEEIKQGIYHEGKAGFVVHLPTHHSPEMAPARQHAMTIYTIAPNQLKEGSWNGQKEYFADRLIACAEAHIPGLSRHITQREILTPEDFRRRTHTRHHAFGGLAPLMNTWKMPHQTPIQGLWFVGAQSESGGGVNGVIPGAYKTAKAILKP